MRGIAISACVAGTLALFSPLSSDAALIAYEGFDYEPNGLTGNSGGIGWGGAWTTQSGRENASVSSGTMTYSDGTLDLITSGNSVTTSGNSRNWRDLGSSFTLDESNPELWIAFLAEANSTGSGHVGIAIFGGSGQSGTEIGTLGKGSSAPNWGFAGLPTGSTSTDSGVAATTESFLVYQFLWSEDGAAGNLWINPSLDGPPQGAPNATATWTAEFTDASWTLGQVRLSSASGNFGNMDELRVGTTFEDVAPIPEPGAVALLGATGLLALRRRRA